MEKVSIIGLDLAKRSFQAHGARAEGGVAFRKKLSREKVLTFLAEQPRCVVAMEACGSAHHWGRTIRDLGHEVRLIPPAYVKPFVKRQKNDAADAEAIVEAASRPTMRFVAVKTEEQQARAMLFRTRDLLVRQRTQLINALRGHLSEHGVVAAQGPANVKVLEEAVEDQGTSLPLLVVELARVFLDQIEGLSKRISGLEKVTAHEAACGETTRRLQTMPGVGPITALAIETFAPPMDVFKCGRDFAAWLGLVPRQHSTGGKQVLGKVSKMGQRDIRRLLIIGAMAVVRSALRKGSPEGSWLQRMLARKPRMLVAIALANKMARSIWAMLAKAEDYRVPVAAAA
jgi:transposase